VCHRHREGDGDVGADDAKVASGNRDAGPAAAVDGLDGGLGRGADSDAKVEVAQIPCRSNEL
jgi:hypothetical protein